MSLAVGSQRSKGKNYGADSSTYRNVQKDFKRSEPQLKDHVTL